MTTHDESEYTLPPFATMKEERTRLGAQGELSFHIGTLIEVLRSSHQVSQIDRILEFSHPDLPSLDILGGKSIDSATVVLGELYTPEDKKAKKEASRETHVMLRLQAGNEVLVINRTSNPQIELKEMTDYIDNLDNIDDPTVLTTNLDQAQLNILLTGLIADYPLNNSDALETIDFLKDPLFLTLSDELEAKADHKQVTGIYSFNNDDSELEFELIDRHESFKLTHTTYEGGAPRSVATAATSSVSSYMQFFIAEGPDVRTVVPDLENIELLKNVALGELKSTQKKMMTTHKLPTILSIVGMEIPTTMEKNIRKVDNAVDERLDTVRAADDLGIEQLLRDADLNQDGLNPPNPGAA